MRRKKGPLKGFRYCANTSPSLKKAGDKKKVHDLENEMGPCQIKRIIQAGHSEGFNSLEAAHNANYENCHWCLGGLKR